MHALRHRIYTDMYCKSIGLSQPISLPTQYLEDASIHKSISPEFGLDGALQERIAKMERPPFRLPPTFAVHFRIDSRVFGHGHTMPLISELYSFRRVIHPTLTLSNRLGNLELS